MLLEIDELSSSVSVGPPGGAAGASAGQAPPGHGTAGPVMDERALLEVLRPLVRRLLQEELQLAMRMRGLR